MAPDNASCHRRRCHTCSFCWSSTLLFWRDVLSCLLLLLCLLPSAGSLPVLTETQAAVSPYTSHVEIRSVVIMQWLRD